MDINKMTAQKIKEIRTNMGISSDYVSMQLGMSKSNYSKLENGHIELTLTKIEALSKVFKLPIESLFPTKNSGIINVTNGDNSTINGTKVNNNDPNALQIIQNAIALLNKLVEKR